MSKCVAYFSYSGVTKKAAEKIAAEQGAGLYEIKPAVPYTEADVNWRDETSRNVLEYKDPACRPEIEAVPDFSEVDELWIGFPVWWYIQPRVINTFLDQADVKNAKIHVFATSGSSSVDGSVEDLRKTYPDLNIVDGQRV